MRLLDLDVPNVASVRATYSTLNPLLFLSNHHSAIVKHASDVVIERQRLLVERLRQDVHFVLQVRPLLSELLLLETSVILDFRREL